MAAKIAKWFLPIDDEHSKNRPMPGVTAKTSDGKLSQLRFKDHKGETYGRSPVFMPANLALEMASGRLAGLLEKRDASGTYEFLVKNGYGIELTAKLVKRS
jgi:hypothetical protein